MCMQQVAERQRPCSRSRDQWSIRPRKGGQRVKARGFGVWMRAGHTHIQHQPQVPLVSGTGLFCPRHTPVHIEGRSFFCTNFLSPRGPGHPVKIPGTSQVSTQGKQTLREQTFRPPPLQVEDPHATQSLRTQKVNLCALSCFLNNLQVCRFASPDFNVTSFYSLQLLLHVPEASHPSSSP